MTSHREVKIGSAVTSATRAEAGTITNAQKEGTLTAIELQVFGTEETVVNSGGLVELRNDAIDWEPFEFYTAGLTCVTEGGGQLKPHRIQVHKKFPAGSTVTIYYTPKDNQSQKLAVTLFWETDVPFSPSEETLAKSGVGSALTQTTAAVDHVTIDIPAEKGGKVVAIQIQIHGTLETIVNSGGQVDLKNKSADPSWEPFSFITQHSTVVDAGGAILEPYWQPCDLDLPAKSKVQCAYTPQDNQSQFLSLVVMWTRGR